MGSVFSLALIICIQIHSYYQMQYAELMDDISGGFVRVTVRQPTQPERTSVIIRNLPFTMTRLELQQFLEENELLDDLNFLFVPNSNYRKRGGGYAFVNFCNESATLKFMDQIKGISLRKKK